MAPAVAGIETHERVPARVGGGARRGVHHTRKDELHVLGQARRSVRGDPPQVRSKEDLGDVGGDVRRGPDAAEQFGRPVAERAAVDPDAVRWICVDGNG